MASDGAAAWEACQRTCGCSAPPTPTPTPRPAACEDSASWLKVTKKGNERTCDWAAKAAKNCNAKSSFDKVKARDACPVACGRCEPEDAGACDDSTSWFTTVKGKVKGCDYVTKKTKRRCKAKSSDKVKAKRACPAACDDACRE